MSNAWMMPDEVFAWLRRNTESAHDVLELGSGEGSARLVDELLLSSLVSIEHDEKFCSPSGPRHIIVHAPIVSGWYDIETVRATAMDFTYDYIIVDGPPGTIGRFGFFENLDLFPDVPMVFDDTHRPAEFELAMSVARQRGKNISIHAIAETGRSFATVGWDL